MIQRIQTVYLLFVVGLLITSMCLPLGYFVDTVKTTYVFTPFSISAGEDSVSSYGIFCILLLSAIVAMATIFLYRNRMLQIRLSIFNSILLIGYYLTFIAFYFVVKGKLADAAFNIHWALGLPLVCIVLNYLAIRAIGKDEVLVKATTRLR